MARFLWLLSSRWCLSLCYTFISSSNAFFSSPQCKRDPGRWRVNGTERWNIPCSIRLLLCVCVQVPANVRLSFYLCPSQTHRGGIISPQTVHTAQCKDLHGDQITVQTGGRLPVNRNRVTGEHKQRRCFFMKFVTVSEKTGEQGNRKTCGYCNCQAAPPINLPSPVASGAVTANNTEVRPQRELVL